MGVDLIEIISLQISFKITSGIIKTKYFKKNENKSKLLLTFFVLSNKNV